MNSLRTEQCLNGWWDFLPVTDPRRQKHHVPERIPVRGWLRETMLVPGSWTRGGSTGEVPEAKRQPWDAWRVFDNYGYPAEWDAMNTAWYRRTFDMPANAAPGRRWLLAFDGILRTARLYVNGQEAGAIPQGIMPADFDITALVRPGVNDLAVFVTDFPRDDNDKILLPAGLDQTMAQKGIWQDVRLLSRPELSIEDVTIRTRVRDNSFEALLTLRNDGASRREVIPALTILDGDRVARQWEGPRTTVPPHAIRKLTIHLHWNDYRPWSCASPTLYHLQTALIEGATLIDQRRDRFGFREVWIDGPDILLNGDPVHLFGDWCHKNTLENFRPEYIRQWYRMLKDCNMNYTRTHMFPHPPVALDLADEMGILVSLESAFAFGGTFALDKPAFWDAAREHVRSIVQRDKNHPSIILWSAGNEVRWSGNRPAIVQHYPGLVKLYQELDPTRIAYADGDSSLWDERSQPLRSRHYGNECSGEQGWDRTQPLHVGEVGNWHFLQPTDACLWGDDAVFASAEACHQAVARECADLAEQARANGACAFFPWNLSGLDNLRPWPEERLHHWEQTDTPHIKPLRSPPYSSEFAWWDPDGPGYAPGPSFAIMRQAFRPLAILIREKRRHFYDDQPIRHSLTLVNDTGGAIEGNLSLCLEQDGAPLWTHTQPARLDKGRRESLSLDVPPIACGKTSIGRTLVCTFVDAGGVRETSSRELHITPRAAKKARWIAAPVAILGGDGTLDRCLRSHGIRTLRIASLATLAADTTPLLIIAKESVQADTRDNLALERYLNGGGRALILEQRHSLFPGTPLDVKPVEMAHIRGGSQDLLASFAAEDFAFWGNSPAATTASDAWVAFMAYRKPAEGNVRNLIELGSGDFGKGGMFWTALFELRQGRGVALACQLRVSDLLGRHPVADRLLAAMLTHLAPDQTRKPLKPIDVIGKASEALALRYDLACNNGKSRPALVLAEASALSDAAMKHLVANVRKGGSAVVSHLDTTTAGRWSRLLKVALRVVDLGPQFCLLRTGNDAVTDGLSHQDLYWIEKVVYGASTAVNTPIAHRLLSCPEAQPLLISEYATCWREFFEQGAGTEWLRMPVTTYLLGNGPRVHAAALLRLPVGKGTLYFCQIEAPPAPHVKSDRCWKQIMHNLGVRITGSPLAGECVSGQGLSSEGFSGELISLLNPDEVTCARAVAAGDAQGEARVPNQRITAAFTWTDLASPCGRAQVPPDTAMAILAYQLDPGRPRKATPVEGGWPDPSQQTLLDLAGDGIVEVTINGRRYEPVTLGADGAGTVADIDLEMQWNTVVVLWRPQGRGSLQMRWRNRQGQPEREFRFTARGW